MSDAYDPGVVKFCRKCINDAAVLQRLRVAANEEADRLRAENTELRAADEELGQENARLEDEITTVVHQRDAARAEADRLRAALREGIEWVETFDCDCFAGNEYQDSEMCDRCLMLKRGRAALDGQASNEEQR